MELTLEDVHEQYDYLQSVIPKNILHNIDPDYLKLVLIESLGIPQPLVN